MKKKWRTRFTKLKHLFRSQPFEAVLYEILTEMRSVESMEDRITWFEHLGQWLAKDGERPGSYPRVRFLARQLAKDSEAQRIFVAHVRQVFVEAKLIRLFLQTGFSDQSGLLQETGRRIVSRLIPTLRELDFIELSRGIIRTDGDLGWFRQMPKDSLETLIAVFDERDRRALRWELTGAAAEALLVFATQLANHGLTAEIRTRSKHLLPTDSPFLRLQIELQRLAVDKSPKVAVDNRVPALLAECAAVIEGVYDDMEARGTSIGLVYRLEVMSAALGRIRSLLDVWVPADRELPAGKVFELFGEAVEATHESQSIVAHVNQQTHLLSRKIAERNGESGDHYIARGKDERRRLFVSALKGGLIVVLMTIVKLTVHGWHLPPLMDATLIWFIYTGGFLAMQFSGSTLATKLPSFTASKLARLMTSARSAEAVDRMFLELRSVLASQGVAFVGNILTVIPGALILEAGFHALFGVHVLGEATAEHTLADLHPFWSLAVPFGMLTGVLLWVSSIAGGWFENWIVFRRVPEAVAQNRRMVAIFGKGVAGRAAQWLEHNASGISANVTLGFLFGFTPFVGLVTGLPLDSRHVTISSASAAFSVLTVWESAEVVRMTLWACGGLVLIGLANLLVSFALALIVAARASAVSPRRFRLFIRLLGRRLLGLD